MNLESDLRIRTPEGIVFSYVLAGPVTRCLAITLDLVIVLLVVLALESVAASVMMVAEDLGWAFGIVAYFVTWVGYGILFEWVGRGQTVGKWALRLRVTDVQGYRLRFHQIFLRNLVRPVDALPCCYLVGGVVALTTRYAQRLGDLAAGTVVVHIPKHQEPDLEQLLAGKYNSLRQHPHLAARLVQRVSAEEARVALQALIRREAIDPVERVGLFAEIAEHFKRIVAFPPETTEGMPDEQYVRNVVDILFRKASSISEPNLSKRVPAGSAN